MVKQYNVFAISLFVLSLLNLSYAFNPDNPFNCTTFICGQSINGSIVSWNCTLGECQILPDDNITVLYNLTNQTIVYNQTLNLSVINQTLNVTTTCNETYITDSLRDYISSLEGRVNASFNCTEKYADVYSMWKTCTNEYQNLNNNSISREQYIKDIQKRDDNITASTQIISKKEDERWQFMIVAFIAGAGLVWYLKVRKDEPRRTDYEPTQNPSVQFNPRAIEDDAKMRELKALRDSQVKSPKKNGDA